MLNAETGLRGYLLTGDDRYLQPYNEAVATINSNLDELRQTYRQLPRDEPTSRSCRSRSRASCPSWT